MTIGIIDDELSNRLLLRSILKTFAPREKVIVDEGLIELAVNQLNKLKPEVIFLDIELRNGTGFDILKQLEYSPAVIFTTAYSQYAIDAIKARAFDYLLKPINETELVESLQKFRDMVDQKKAAISPIQLQGFFNIATNEGRISLGYKDIVYFESSGSYTYCATQTKKMIFSKNIGEVEKEIDMRIFYRCHHSYIVNLTKIARVEIKRNGRIFLNNNQILPLAQRKIKEFRSLFNKTNGK